MECLHISIDILGGWHLIWDEHLFEVEWVVWTVTEVHGLDRGECSGLESVLGKT